MLFRSAEYTRKIFSMYGGEEFEVTMLVNNELVGVIADRFGDDIFIVKENDNQFRFSAKISISSQFYAWVFGLGGGVKILSPQRETMMKWVSVSPFRRTSEQTSSS